MSQIRIEIPGNAWRGRINVRTGRAWSAGRRDAKAYLDEVADWTRRAVRAQGQAFAHGPLEAWLTLVVPDRRRRDLDGPIKTLLDGVTAGGGWGDDSQVEILHVRRTVERGQARAVLVVRSLTRGAAGC